MEERKAKAIELAAATFEDLIAVRGDAERIWASVLKEAIKRRNPGFNESYYGYKTFGTLLEDAAVRGLLGVGRDEKSGTYVTRASGRPVPGSAPVAEAVAAVADTLENTLPARKRSRPHGAAVAVAARPRPARSRCLHKWWPKCSRLNRQPLKRHRKKKRAASKAKAPARPRRAPRKKTEAPAAE
jgi:hypothetical protein